MACCSEDSTSVFANSEEDVPEWMKGYHDWKAAVNVNELPKLELKVKMCCLKCEEKVVEEIREVRGVFDVKADWLTKKVIVVATPGAGACSTYQSEVLTRAKTIHVKAKIVKSEEGDPPANGEKDPVKHPDTGPAYDYVVPPLIWDELVDFHGPECSKATQPCTAWCYNSDFPSKVCRSEGFITNLHYMKHRTWCSCCFGYANVSCSSCGRLS